MTVDRILLGRIVGHDAGRGAPGAVAIAGNRFVAVGGAADILRMRTAQTDVLGELGGAIVPGFVDAHLHFTAMARRRVEIDCSPGRCDSIADLLLTLAAASRSRPRGAWIRAFGYDESFLAEGRPPSLAELDEAAPDRPLRLLHRTGQAAILNGAALDALGLRDHPGLERGADGLATGLLFEPGEIFRGRIPSVTGDEIEALCGQVSERLLAVGITTVHDPTPGQTGVDLELLRRLQREGKIRQRLRTYGGGDTPEVGAIDDEWFRRCGRKIVVTERSDAGEIARVVADADRRGWQVAIHAVEEGPLAVAIAALRALGRDRVATRRHRIEHASWCPPALAGELAACGATVVTHPAFLSHFGRKYRREVPAEQWSWLYPLGTLAAKGVPIALGSDAPVASPGPLATIAAAAHRRRDDGAPESGQEVSVRDALRWHTEGGAAAGGDVGQLGRISVGFVADAVLLDRDPTAVPPGQVGTIAVRATILDGKVAWAA